METLMPVEVKMELFGEQKTRIDKRTEVKV